MSNHMAPLILEEFLWSLGLAANEFLLFFLNPAKCDNDRRRRKETEFVDWRRNWSQENFSACQKNGAKIMAKTLVKLSDILLENCFWLMALTDVEFWVGWRINYSPVFSLPQFTGLPRSWLPIKNVNLTLGERLELNHNLFHGLPLLMQIH